MNAFWLLSTALLILTPASRAQNPIPPTCHLKWTGLPYDQNGHYHPECQISVLYSWLTDKSVIDAKDPLWPIRRGRAFFYRSPLGTLMYGKYSYRVKLKPGLTFKLEDWDDNHFRCRHPEEEKRHTVYVNQDKRTGFSEYVLCSNDPIESWSFGMPEHLQEMKTEYALIQKLGPKNVDGFLDPSRASQHANSRACSTCFQGYTIRDARNGGDLAALKEAFGLMEQSIRAHEGRVFVPSTREIKRSGPTVQKHFNGTVSAPSLPALEEPQQNESRFTQMKLLQATANQTPATSAVKKHCHGDSCLYKISRQFLPGDGSISSFNLKWKCCDSNSNQCSKTEHTLAMNDADLEGKMFRFGCTTDGSALYKSRGGRTYVKLNYTIR